MECLAIFRQSRQPLDGQDLSSICLHGEDQTRTDTLAVEQNGAAASDSLLAAQMSSGKPKMVALIAVARKILTILNAMIRNKTQWQPA